MPLGKRKERDEDDNEIPVYEGDDMEETDDEENLTRAPNQVLPIAKLSANFSGVPRDGMEYLFTVRRDARMRPRFTRVLNPNESSTERTNPAIVPRQTGVHARFPADAWRGSFLEHFRNCRRNLSRYSEAEDSWTPERLPPFSKHQIWWRYVTGAAPESGNPHLADNWTNRASLSGIPDDPAGLSPSAEPPHEPTWKRMTSIPQKNVLGLLSLFGQWIADQENLSPHSPYLLQPVHERWLFALLMRLDDHLIADHISELRVLARACISHVKHQVDSGSEESMAGYWMVVVAIAYFWGQKDIWEEARTRFAT